MPKDATGHLVPGVVGPAPVVPASIPRPEYVGRPAPAAHVGGDVYDAKTIERIRTAGRVAAGALDAVARAVEPGVTTDALDRIAHAHLVDHGAYPSTLGYRGYPRSSCTSVNEVVCHGIPDDTVLEEGDIVNVDVTAYLDGVHGDTNRTFRVGAVAPEVDALVDRTEEALRRAIAVVRPGRRVNVIGRSIESYAARFGYGVVRDFTGHGVGTSFHSGLVIPHHDSDEYATEIVPGMVFTIEPMLTLGGAAHETWADGWTAVTRDRSITAQFEHTIAVTDDGADILTLPTTTT
ncbi:type I methionyl aminopeptidase [Agrococcus sp. SGAir0287]|uniref:type I methionyl aminopeptidase n=1 Tax=Agrococcus sp. SGAir0287 TaxID=2070347 RepID=UPI0010CCC06B|nr:type I methionyl aminopeptidase [Agrococcus sp. SGAir0287]QCR19389.1 type I methionyl aminopeptidase [Agrococcus sp. SGAir0287]